MSDYEDIPLQGKHRGSTPGEDAHEASTSVRAQQPPDAPGEEEATSTYQLLKSNLGGGTYRVQAWKPGEEATVPEDHEEVGRYDTGHDAQAALEGALGDPSGAPRYVVLESTETGEVQLSRLRRLSDKQFSGTRYDRFTLFADEDAAARYADARTAGD